MARLWGGVLYKVGMLNRGVILNYGSFIGVGIKLDEVQGGMTFLPAKEGVCV